MHLNSLIEGKRCISEIKKITNNFNSTANEWNSMISWLSKLYISFFFLLYCRWSTFFFFFFVLKFYITYIFSGEFIRIFSPRWHENPRVLCHPLPSALGDITLQGFPVTSGKIFWYIALEVMLCIIERCRAIGQTSTGNKTLLGNRTDVRWDMVKT
jgi:hypothetical protein